jgi:hypothetical protein
MYTTLSYGDGELGESKGQALIFPVQYGNLNLCLCLFISLPSGIIFKKRSASRGVKRRQKKDDRINIEGNHLKKNLRENRRRKVIVHDRLVIMIMKNERIAIRRITS